MASTYPNQQDTFPGAPYTDGIEFVLAAYANFWISCITALEATIGSGSGTSSSNPLYSTTKGVTYSTVTARIAAIEASAAGGISLNGSAGNIKPVGSTAGAGSTGSAADASHVHVGVTSITVSGVLSNSGNTQGAVSLSITGGGMVQTTYDPAGIDQQVVGTTATQTLTNKFLTPRVVTVAAGATPSINSNNGDQFVITGLATAVTSFTTNLTGSPSAGQLMMIVITDNGSAQNLTWGSKFASSTIFLPGITVGGQIMHVGFRWNNAASVWVCIGVA